MQTYAIRFGKYKNENTWSTKLSLKLSIELPYFIKINTAIKRYPKEAIYFNILFFILPYKRRTKVVSKNITTIEIKKGEEIIKLDNIFILSKNV